MDQTKIVNGLKWRRPASEDDLKNTKCQVSQHPLVGSYSKFKLKLTQPKITNVANEDLHRKTTSKYKMSSISTATGRILHSFKHKLSGPNQSVQRSHINTTCIGRWPENIKCQISLQPLVWFYSNFKLKLEDQIKVYKGLKSRRLA